MNILFIHDHEVNPYKGGMQRVSYLLAEEFARRGHHPAFLSLKDDPQDYSGKGKFPQDTLSLQRLGADTLKVEVEKYVRDRQIGLVVLQNPEVQYRGPLSGLKDITTTVFVFHNQPYPLLGKERKIKKVTPRQSLQMKGKLLRLLGIISPGIFRKLYLRQFRAIYKAIADNSTKYILLSDRYIPRLLDNTPGIEKEKVTAINNPITFSVEEAVVDMDLKENIVLVLCRMSNPQKNLTDFIDVWKEFSQREPKWRAIIVGDGESREAIEKYAKRKGAERIEFAGNRENVQDYYKKSKIFCMTSAYEGWPMVLMESMAFGCVPVVYDTFEAIHDVVTDGKEGVIVPPFDTHAMASAMTDLAQHPDKLKRMAEAGPSKLKDYTGAAIADEWEAKVMAKDTAK